MSQTTSRLALAKVKIFQAIKLLSVTQDDADSNAEILAALSLAYYLAVDQLDAAGSTEDKA